MVNGGTKPVWGLQKNMQVYLDDPDPEPQPEWEAEPWQEQDFGRRGAEALSPSDLRAEALLVALASCPFAAAVAELREAKRQDGRQDAAGGEPDAAPPSPALTRELEESALTVVRTSAALAKRADCGRRLAVALSQPCGLGDALRALRLKAEAGDASAAAAMSEFDALRVHAGVGGVDAAARARRLELALELPGGLRGRRDKLKEAVALCFVAAEQPDDEDEVDAQVLLVRALSDLGLEDALDSGDIEF